MKQFAILCCLLGSWFLYSNSNQSSAVLNNHESSSIHPTDSLAMANGYNVFSSRCHSCHTTTISHAYDSTQWNSILSRMSINAGLDSTQQIDLSNYIFNQLAYIDTSFVLRTVGGYQQW